MTLKINDNDHDNDNDNDDGDDGDDDDDDDDGDDADDELKVNPTRGGREARVVSEAELGHLNVRSDAAGGGKVGDGDLRGFSRILFNLGTWLVAFCIGPGCGADFLPGPAFDRPGLSGPPAPAAWR